MSTAIPLFDPSTASLEPGVSLIEASAGTGKTHSIIQLVLRLLLDRKADGTPRVRGIGSILVVTFTTAATDELITRIRAALRDAIAVFTGVVTEREGRDALFALFDRYGNAAIPRLREALASLDTLAVFTIHAWSMRTLDESALESGTPFTSRFLEDDHLLLDRMAQDWWRRRMYEDAGLASLAVQREWRHDAFLKDLATWQRLPGARLEPDMTLPAARAALDDAVRALASRWDSTHVAEFLAERKWYARSTLNGPRAQADIVRAGEALRHGDLGAAALLAERCTSAAMLDPKTGLQKKPAGQADAVPHEPFVRGCDALAVALVSLHAALRVDCLMDVRDRFAAEKRRRHLVSYDDMLRHLHDAMEAGGTDGPLAVAIRARYDAALIDEFQDTDPYQFPVFAQAFRGRPLFLIGDPKQAIFSFRGADLYAYLRARATAGSIHTIGRNRRSTGPLVSAVNALFSRRPQAFLHPDIPFIPVVAQGRPDPLAGDGRGALHWWVIPPSGGDMMGTGDATTLSHAAMSRELLRLLSSSTAPVSPGQVAVLVRSGREGLAVRALLQRLGVPCIVSGLGSIIESREMRELETVLRALLAPGDAGVVRAALATELWGCDAAAIHALSAPAREGEWQDLIERLTAWRDEWLTRGFMTMVQGLLGALDVSRRMLAHDDGERRLTNIRHAVELLHDAADDDALSPEGLLQWVSTARATGDTGAEHTELRLETDADAVRITTIHKSKGLEYDIVFCPGLFTTRRSDTEAPVLVHLGLDEVVFDHGSPERTMRGTLAAAEELAEDLRLLYVALTRATLRCYVTWGAVKARSTHAGHTALGYLFRDSRETGTPAELAERVPIEFAARCGEVEHDVGGLVRESEGSMTLEMLDAPMSPGVPLSARGRAVGTPVFRTDLPVSESLRTWRVASFTSLTAGRHADDLRDVSDAGVSAERARPLADTDFLAFPAGRLPGVALHELFERLDFAASPAVIVALTNEVLSYHGLGGVSGRVEAVAGMAARVCSTLLPGAGFPLCEVPASSTLREWAFHLPLGVVETGMLARIFAEHGGELGRRYAPALRRLAGERVQGFLAGVVDLACERSGKWYLVDWKSNHLGRDPAAYRPDALEHEMFESHYVLQYHLYLVALHRFLRLRAPGYAYDTHIAGAWYAFLRGIDGTDRGWFRDRPPRALIEALDGLMSPSQGIEAVA